MKPLASALLAILLTACTNRSSTAPASPEGDTPKTANSPQTNTTSDRDTTFRPGFFASFPDTLHGCSSYFTYDTMKVETGNYIFLTNYQELALIKVGGKEIYLHKDSAESRRPTEDKSIDVYRGGGYTVVLETQRVRSIDEVSYYTGTLRITGNRIDVQYPVHGEGGC